MPIVISTMLCAESFNILHNIPITTTHQRKIWHWYYSIHDDINTQNGNTMSQTDKHFKTCHPHILVFFFRKCQSRFGDINGQHANSVNLTESAACTQSIRLCWHNLPLTLQCSPDISRCIFFNELTKTPHSSHVNAMYVVCFLVNEMRSHLLNTVQHSTGITCKPPQARSRLYFWVLYRSYW